MSRKKQHSKQFKLDAVQYRKEHPDLSQVECARNLGIGTSTLSRWESQYRDNSGNIPTRGSSNFSSDEQKEIAHLKRELRDARDALDVLKKPSAFWATTDRSCLYRSCCQGRGCQSRTPRVSISGMLKFLGVLRSGYHAFLHRTVSVSRQRKESVKQLIRQIYDKPNQNYGAPKITREFRKSGIRIAERAVGIYMKQMDIRAQWVKPWTATTRNSDFSSRLHNILNEQFNPESPDTVWCTDITYIWTHEGFVYLTNIMDLYARKIIAWTLSDSMEVSCVIDTINKAKAHRRGSLPHIIHSDRESQYVSQAYCDATTGIQRSYSHTGYPYDNACIKAFHSLIKWEG